MATHGRCAACRFWVGLGKNEEAGEEYEVGACHRYPPPPVAPDRDADAFAMTYENDWCGEFVTLVVAVPS